MPVGEIHCPWQRRPYLDSSQRDVATLHAAWPSPTVCPCERLKANSRSWACKPSYQSFSHSVTVGMPVFRFRVRRSFRVIQVPLSSKLPRSEVQSGRGMSSSPPDGQQHTHISSDNLNQWQSRVIRCNHWHARPAAAATTASAHWQCHWHPTVQCFKLHWQGDNLCNSVHWYSLSRSISDCQCH